ncbi:MAG: YHS domain-containing protein [Capsulimonadales bacterium]|nr:YHS domain-containing protein [Capsulimonadales bacterium]
MKRIALSLVTVVAFSAVTAFAQEKPAAKKPAKTEVIANAIKGGKAICPIMKEEFPVKTTSARSNYKGKTYVFCCEGCKPEFDKAPAKYAAAAKPAPKTSKPKS